MGFRHVLHLIVIISIVEYAASSDSMSFLNDDLLFSDTGFSSSTEAPALEQPEYSLDLSSSFEDANNDNLFSSDNDDLQDTDNTGLFLTNNAGLDDKGDGDLFSTPNAGLDDESVQMADCSSSEASPVIGKSRIRRGNAFNACIDPGTGPFQSQGLPSDAAGGESHRKNLGIFSLGSALGKYYEKRQNGVCKAVTVGSLPWGVCYQPTEVPLQPIGTSVVPPDSGGTLFSSYIVDPGTVGKSESGAKLCSIC